MISGEVDPDTPMPELGLQSTNGQVALAQLGTEEGCFGLKMTIIYGGVMSKGLQSTTHLLHSQLPLNAHLLIAPIPCLLPTGIQHTYLIVYLSQTTCSLLGTGVKGVNLSHQGPPFIAHWWDQTAALKIWQPTVPQPIRLGHTRLVHGVPGVVDVVTLLVEHFEQSSVVRDGVWGGGKDLEVGEG